MTLNLSAFARVLVFVMLSLCAGVLPACRWESRTRVYESDGRRSNSWYEETTGQCHPPGDGWSDYSYSPRGSCPPSSGYQPAYQGTFSPMPQCPPQRWQRDLLIKNHLPCRRLTRIRVMGGSVSGLSVEKQNGIAPGDDALIALTCFGTGEVVIVADVVDAGSNAYFGYAKYEPSLNPNSSKPILWEVTSFIPLCAAPADPGSAP